MPTRSVPTVDTSEVKTPGFEEADAIGRELIQMFEDGKYDVAHLIYPNFKSAIVQEPTADQLIPVPAPQKVENTGADRRI